MGDDLGFGAIYHELAQFDGEVITSMANYKQAIDYGHAVLKPKDHKFIDALRSDLGADQQKVLGLLDNLAELRTKHGL